MPSKIRQPPSPVTAERRLRQTIAQIQERILRDFQVGLAAMKDPTPAQVEALAGRLQRKYAQAPAAVTETIKAQGLTTLAAQETAFSAGITVSSQAIAAQAAAMETLPQFVQSTEAFLAKLNSDALTRYTETTLRALEQGKTLADIQAALGKAGEIPARHANTVARTQIANFNAVSGQARASSLGVKQAIWRTSQDERVRESHRDRNGKTFDLAAGLYSDLDGLDLVPGVDYNCRCIAEYIVPDFEPPQ